MSLMPQFTTLLGRGDFQRHNAYKVTRTAGDNAIKDTILVVLPDYDKSTREKKEGKMLDCDQVGLVSMTLSSSFSGNK